MPLAEAIHFGRRLEAFHDLFTTLLADILGDKLPLVRRFRDPAMTGEPEYRPHVVYYFASKAEYVDYFRNRAGAAARELGYYDPPKSERGRVPAYFFRDPEGELPVEANLYHEVSHQLLFETAPSNAYTKNFGNYWVFEGLGTYFETVLPQDDGSLEVGGMVGRRIEAALSSLVNQKRKFPLAEFIALGEPAFKRDSPRIVLYYQQAMALTVFLMQWRAGTYRDAFLDYVHDAYRGRIKRTTGRSLQDRLGQPYETLDRQFLTFLESARAALRVVNRHPRNPRAAGSEPSRIHRPFRAADRQLVVDVGRGSPDPARCRTEGLPTAGCPATGHFFRAKSRKKRRFFPLNFYATCASCDRRTEPAPTKARAAAPL